MRYIKGARVAILIGAFIALTAQSILAQETQESSQETTQESQKPQEKKKDKKDKNLKFSIIGGPGYTPDYGFLVGGSSLFTFDMPGMKGSKKRSVVPLAFSLSFSNKVSASFLIRPQLYIADDNIRVKGEYIYSNLAGNYYGVGYSTNSTIERGSTTTLYFNSQVNINPIVVFRVAQSNWFIGPTYHLQRDHMQDPSQGIIDDPDYINAGGTSNGLILLNSGIGFSGGFDSRDIPSNAYSGIYFDVKGIAYGNYFGGDSQYQLLEIDYRQYVQLSKSKTGRTLAWTLYSENLFGDVPFTRMATVGSAFDLRGYYQGQYRDKSAHLAMMEYRHKFHAEPVNFWSKAANRLGFAVWMGTGLLGPSPFKIEGVLPNYGAGLRIEVQPRMNFRIDVGHSPIDNQTLFYMNMTEAF